MKIEYVSIFLILCIFSLSLNSCNNQKKDPLEVVRSIPIAELSVYEFTFNIITQAKQTQDGNFALQISTGGFFGQDDNLVMLYEGNVSVKYGINLDTIAVDRIDVLGNKITIRLPSPKVIGLPNIIDEGVFRSQVLDVKDPGWFFAQDITGLEKVIRETYQKETENWVQRYQLDALIKKRVTEIIRSFLKVSLGNVELSVVFDSVQE